MPSERSCVDNRRGGHDTSPLPPYAESEFPKPLADSAHRRRSLAHHHPPDSRTDRPSPDHLDSGSLQPEPRSFTRSSLALRETGFLAARLAWSEAPGPFGLRRNRRRMTDRAHIANCDSGSDRPAAPPAPPRHLPARRAAHYNHQRASRRGGGLSYELSAPVGRDCEVEAVTPKKRFRTPTDKRRFSAAPAVAKLSSRRPPTSQNRRYDHRTPYRQPPPFASADRRTPLTGRCSAELLNGPPRADPALDT